MQKIKLYDKEYEMIDEIVCDCGCEFKKDNSIGLVSYSCIKLCELHMPKIDIEELKQQKIKEIENKVSEIIKNKFGSITRQFNIINELGYDPQSKKEYIIFANQTISQEKKFISQVLDTKNLEDLKKFNFEFKIK